MAAIVPSIELIQRTLDCEVSYTLSRMRVLERIERNPIGIAYRKAGRSGWALSARHLPVPSFNAVIGLKAGDESDIAPVLQWYRDHDVRPQIEIVPGCESEVLLLELLRLGYHHSGFHVSMIARPADAAAPDAAIDIARVPLVLASQYGARRDDASVRPGTVDAAVRVHGRYQP